MAEVILKDVSKIYDDKNIAVKNVSFTVKDKEFLVLVGPSGCGKTTTLRMVAVGRAIVRHPKVFLFDEPLSNLDAKLRVQMRTELAKLHNRLEVTILYVTHDQTEAMTMGIGLWL